MPGFILIQISAPLASAMILNVDEEIAMNESQEKFFLDVLAQAPDITIATNRADGWPQATTVSFVYEGLALYFLADARSQKCANIEMDGRVSVTANAPYLDWRDIRSLSMAGDAWFVTNPAEITHVSELMSQRCGPGLYAQILAAGRRSRIVRIRPHIVSLIDYSKGFGHKTDLVLAAGTSFPVHAA